MCWSVYPKSVLGDPSRSSQGDTNFQDPEVALVQYPTVFPTRLVRNHAKLPDASHVTATRLSGNMPEAPKDQFCTLKTQLGTWL